jgi:putative transposase
MIAFIDDHRGAHGVEPICKVLPIAPSTYHAHVARRRDPAGLSARARQDAVLKIEVRRVFDQNFRVLHCPLHSVATDAGHGFARGHSR